MGIYALLSQRVYHHARKVHFTYNCLNHESSAGSYTIFGGGGGGGAFLGGPSLKKKITIYNKTLRTVSQGQLEFMELLSYMET